MKNDKLHACLIAMGLSFCLGFGGVACMVTGLRLQADLVGLALCCGVATVLLCLLVSLPRGGWGILALIAGCLVLVWLWDGYRAEWTAMLRAVFKYYEMAYGLAVPDLLDGPAVTSHLLPLLSLHSLISMVASWLLLRRYPVAMAVFLSLIPMAACFVVTDTVPQLWCILLYLFGLVLLLISHPVRSRDEAQGIRLTGLMAVPVAAALALLCMAVPQEGYEPPQDPITSFEELWEVLGETFSFISTTSDGKLVISFGNDMPDRVDLDDLGKRIQRPTPVMELETTFSGMVYLRGRDHDVYDGVSWSASKDRTEQNFVLPEGWRYTRGFMKITQLSKRDHLYVPYYPRVSPVISGGLVENTDGTTEQAFDCITLIGNWESLWRKGAAPGTDLMEAYRYLTLPEDTMTQAQSILAQLYAQSVVQPETDVLTTADMIRQYVQTCAQYDLDPDRMPEGQDDLAIWFLQEADRGYCVHFATAAAVLLRAAGIPARYVEGYLVPAQADQITLVRDDMAHAWVEYYVDGLGWMVLDATPGFGGEELPETTQPEQTTAPAPTDPTVTEPTAPTETTAATRPSETTQATTPSGGTKEPSRPLPGWFKGLLTGLLTLGLLTGGVVLQWYLRRRHLLGRMYRGKVNAQALARFREIKRLSRLTKIPYPDELDRLAERACFSQYKLTPEELTALETALRECVHTLQQKGWLHRLYHRVIWAAY